MNRRTSRSVWLLLFILALGGGPRSFGAVPDPALVNFQSWAKSYVTASTTVRPGLEAEGLKLATARQPVFQKLIREDPAQALANAIPEDTLKLLPDSIRAQLEYWYSGRAGNSLFSAGPLPEKWANYRELLIHGQVFRTFVYGRRINQYTFWDNPVYGVAMGNELAVAADPVRILQAGTPSNPAITADVGGQICKFANTDELNTYVQAILNCEQIVMDQEGKTLAGRATNYSTTVTVDFSTNDLHAGPYHEYTQVVLAGAEPRDGKPGEPRLPCKTVYVQIPAGAVATQIAAEVEQKVVLNDVLVYPVQPFADADKLHAAEFCLPDTNIYSQADLWPAQPYERVQVKRIRGQSYVALRVLPVRYRPGKRQVVMATRIQLKLDCVWPKARPAMIASGIQDMNDLLGSKLVLQSVPASMPQPEPLPVSITPAVAGGIGACDYLIITTAALRDAFDDFVAHRRDFSGFRVALKTVEEIAAEYPSWPDGSACPLRASIRSCIRDYVQNRGVVYVLLGGPAPDIPTYYFNTVFDLPGPWNLDLEEFCTDEYYSSLNEPIGLWNSFMSSGMGFGVSPPRTWIEVGGYDSDVLVGRLPLSSQEEIRRYSRGMISYEKWPPLELAGKALLVGNEIFRTFSGNDRPAGSLRDGYPGFFADRHTRVSDSETWLRRVFLTDIQQEESDWPRERLSIFCDTLTSWDDPDDTCGNYELTTNHLTARLAEGWNQVVWMAHGGCEIENGVWTASEIAGGQPVLSVMNAGCSSARFDRWWSVGATLLRYFGTLNYVGYSGLGYVADDWRLVDAQDWLCDDTITGPYHARGGPAMLGLRDMLAASVQGGEINVGRAFAAARSTMGDRGDNDATFDFYGYTADKMTLLGDPAIDMIGILPQVQLTCDNPQAVEGGAAFEITFSRRNDFRNDLPVKYHLSGPATPGTDFGTSPPQSYGGEIVIPAGSASRTIRFAAQADRVREGAEYISVYLDDGPGYEVCTHLGILPDGGEGPIRSDYVSISVMDATESYTLTVTAQVAAVTEGSLNPAILRVVRTGSADLSDALRFKFVCGFSPDLNNTDMDLAIWHLLQSGNATFSPGQAFFDIPVVPRNDLVDEGVEEIFFRLLPGANPRDYNIDSPSSASIRIVDDDIDPVIRLVQPEQDLQLVVGDPLSLRAEASDQDDGVKSVEFWLDENLMLGEKLETPYEICVATPWFRTAGNHVLRAKVIDNSGAYIWSASRNIRITPIPAGAGQGILRQQWNNLAGGNLNALFADARYPQRPTEADDRWNAFCSDGYPDWGDAYAERLRGYFLAPATGDYRFLLQGNDYAELRLSTDDQPAHNRMLTSIYCTTNVEDPAVFPTQTSAVVRLVAGQRYYIEALHKEATGSDWLLAGVILPGGQREMPIPGNRLDPWIVQPGLEIMPFGMAGSIGDVQVTEGTAGNICKVVLNSEPDADVEVWPAVDSQQIQTLPDHLVFPRATWWQPQRLTVIAVDDAQAEVSPKTTTMGLNWSSDDVDFNDLPTVYVPVSVVDNETNLPPQAARVWPKARKVYTTAANVQVVFEVQASDDGQPGPMTNTWSQQAGANLQTGIVANTRTTNTLGVFPRAGNYGVLFTAAEAMAQTNLDFIIQTGATSTSLKLVNFAPVVSAGVDLTVLTNAVTALKGSASDDGLPANPGKVTVQWQKLSGPGTVVFSNTTTAATAFYAKTAGSYVLRLTAHDGEVKVCDDVAVTVKSSGLLLK